MTRQHAFDTVKSAKKPFYTGGLLSAANNPGEGSVYRGGRTAGLTDNCVSDEHDFIS